MFVVPGLVGVILTMTMIMLTAMAIARERERGTLEQLVVSPIGRVELMVGKIIPYVGIGYIQMTLVLLLGTVAFRTPLVGSALLLYVLALLFIAANLALGLLFSTVAKTQQQAMQLSFFFLLPNILLSGFMFPYEAMPRPAQWMAQALPLTHFLRIVRGIALKGAGFADLRGELGALCSSSSRWWAWRPPGSEEGRLMGRRPATSPPGSCMPPGDVFSPTASRVRLCGPSPAKQTPASA